MAHPTPYRTGSASAMDADLGGSGDGKTDKARAELSLLLRCSSIVVGKEPIGAVVDPLHREEALRSAAVSLASLCAIIAGTCHAV